MTYSFGYANVDIRTRLTRNSFNTYQIPNSNINNFNNFEYMPTSFTNNQTSTSKQTKIQASHQPAEKALTQKDITEVWNNGENVFNTINGKTEDKEYKNITKTLNSLNKNTIVAFLDGYYQAKSEESIESSEGIIEHLDDEYDGGKISMKSKLNIVKSLLEAAKAKGLDQMPKISKAVLELEEIYKQYNSGNLKSKKDFDNNKEVSWSSVGNNIVAQAGIGAAAGAAIGVWGCGIAAAPGAIIGGIAGVVTGAITGFCDPITDDERIDKLITTIYQALA